jgi:hypothetical protein
MKVEFATNLAFWNFNVFFEGIFHAAICSGWELVRLAKAMVNCTQPADCHSSA